MSRKVGKKDIRYLAKLVTEDRAPCAFCFREVDDEVTYGKFYAIGDIQCHYFCALLSCCLVQKGPEQEGLFGFMYKDILAELERSKKHKCSFCGRGGANLGCSVASCRKQFHLPCGRDRNVVSLYYGTYKSFCQIHAPNQRIPEHIMCKARLRMKKRNKIKISTDLVNGDNTTDEEMVCVICYEAVDAFPTVNTFWPPCCARDAWLHRTCLQRMSLSAGMHYLKCPLCNDKQSFYKAVVSQGYYVPDRDAAWELEQNAFSEIYERPLVCNVEDCQCPMGRSHDAEGMWDIKLCLLCGSVGGHAQCTGASETSRYVCATCSPAAPPDLQALAETIEKLISQEQAKTVSGPMMPSRMSLRRTKGRLCNFASSSREEKYFKTECTSPAPSPNILSSRQELNLNSPRKLIKSSKSNSYKNTELYKNIEAKLLSPMKNLEQIWNEKCMGVENAVLDEKVLDTLRRKLRKPRPLTAKKKIVNDILDGLIDNLNSTLKQKDAVREWCSPRKCYDITEKENQSTASENVANETEITVENKENYIQKTPEKYKGILLKVSTPNKIQDTPELGDATTIKTPRLKQNEDALYNKATNNTENIEENCTDLKEKDDDESSNSTFQLPSEFIAETLSDDSCMNYVAKEIEITVENKENSIQKTPEKYKGILPKVSTPNKIEDTPELGDATTIKTPRLKQNEDALYNKATNNTENIEENCTDLKEKDDDESSNSTFQLPSEFIAETLSDDICLNYVAKETEITVENKENGIQKTPEKYKGILPKVSTPNKIEDTPELGDATTIKTPRLKQNEDALHNKATNKIENIEENCTDLKEKGDDESSNSTFQLPSEFIAETLSDDSCMAVLSQNRKTVEIKQDSSLEIFEQDHSVNIDVVKLDDSLIAASKKLDVMKKQCAFKFSPLDNEKLEESNVGIDLESFKKEYLNEVGREFKCFFDHKHNNNTSIEKADAHLNVAHVKRNKRQLSESSLILYFDRCEIKRRKMSENDLNFSFSNSSDDFEIKKEFKSSGKKEAENVEVDKVRIPSLPNKIKKQHVKYKQRESESRKKRVKIMSFKDKLKKRANDEKLKLKDEENSLVEIKLDNKEKHRKVDSERTRVKDSEESVQKKSVRNEDRNVKDEEKSLLDKKLDSKRKNIQELENVVIHRKKTDNKRRCVKDILNSEKRVRGKIIQVENIGIKDKDKLPRVRKLDIEEKRRKVKELESEKRRVKDKTNYERRRVKERKRDKERKKYTKISLDDEKSVREKLVHDDNRKLGKEEKNLKDIIRARENHSVKDKHKKRVNKSENNAKDRKDENDQSIEVTIDSSKNKKSKNKLKTKLSINNNEKDISVKIKWKKKQLRLKIESKKAKAEKDEKDNSKFKQYVLQYFSEVTPKEVLVKPEKDVSPLKRKYVKQEKTPDKFKQMSIQNFFKVKSPTE